MIKWVRRLQEDESGQVMILVAILMVGLVAVVGLVTDGGMVFSQRRDLQNVADSAAAAGASQIDEDAYRASAGASVVLDETAAYDAAARYLDDEGDLDYSVTVAPDRVDVSASRRGPAPAGARHDGVEITARPVSRDRDRDGECRIWA